VIATPALLTSTSTAERAWRSTASSTLRGRSASIAIASTRAPSRRIVGELATADAARERTPRRRAPR
jgi:hypothetical protein